LRDIPLDEHAMTQTPKVADSTVSQNKAPLHLEGTSGMGTNFMFTLSTHLPIGIE
jgi:hypothetical protein